MSAYDVRAGEEEDRAIRHRTEVLLVIAALVVLVISALPAQHGESSRAERTVFRWINDLPDVLYGPVNVVMQLGNIVAVVVVAVIALLFRRYRLAFGLALAGVGAYFIATVIKHLVDRGRPTDLIDHVHVRGEQAAGLGYVSGHAAVAFAVVTVATMWFEGKVPRGALGSGRDGRPCPRVRRRAPPTRRNRRGGARDRLRRHRPLGHRRPPAWTPAHCGACGAPARGHLLRSRNSLAGVESMRPAGGVLTGRGSSAKGGA